MTISAQVLTPADVTPFTPAEIGTIAARCLHQELQAYPKPGLVSPIDTGSHSDMDIVLMRASADVLKPYFARFAAAGAAGADMTALRELGVAAEREMLVATGGVNAHRGAIFGMGLLAAAAGAEGFPGESIGGRVARLWGAEIRSQPASSVSNGGRVIRRFGVGGASAEAATGFPTLYRIGLKALHEGAALAGGFGNTAYIHTLFRLIAVMEDTNLLHRGGAEGLAFAQAEAAGFLASGGICQRSWRDRAIAIHHAFVDRNLSPGGAADLLAMSLFVQAVEAD